MKTVVAIIQARMGSTRLPGKVLLPLVGRPTLLHVVERTRWASSLSSIIVATSDLPRDEPIRKLCAEEGIRYFAGDEQDVLDRYYQASLGTDADAIVRITADCPLVEPTVIDSVVNLWESQSLDYAASAAGGHANLTAAGAFPEGLSVECFSASALERAWRESTDAFDREHVTPYIWNTGRFNMDIFPFASDRGELRLTVDTASDYALVAEIYEALYRKDRPFTLSETIRYLDQKSSNCEQPGYRA